MPREDAELVQRVARVAGAVAGTAPSPDAPLGLDSLGIAELALALEEEFGVRIDEGEALETAARAARAVAAGLGRRRSPSPVPSAATGRFQELGRTLVGPALSRFFRLRVTGAYRVPRSGPVVLGANHESMWDVPVLVVACPRPIVFMAKEEIFDTAVKRRFFTELGGFAVHSGPGDVRALRAALAVLASGGVLGMFPETTRSPGTLLPFRGGAAWVALAAGAPLVPVALFGTGGVFPKGARLPRRVRVSVSFGVPIEVGHEGRPRARLRDAARLAERLRSDVEGLLAG